MIKLPKKRESLIWLALAHARRYFEKALDNDAPRAQKALLYIQKLYQVEAQAREENLSPEQRKERRLDQSLPVLNEMGKWISQDLKHLLPKSPIAKAFNYSMNRWEQLSNYLLDGRLEIDR